MGRFAVPRMLQQKVLLIGVMLALLMRGAVIAAGAAVVDRFVWVFYLFGAFLIYTAIALARQHQGGEDEFRENVMIRWSRRILPMSAQYDGARLTTYAEPGDRAGNRSGRRIFTPMLIVMIAIGSTDLLFALDSIPAIFGLTKQSYLVFTANAFALMGLRQLYFLLGGLLDRLVYLNRGLAVILAFIGVKLILEAVHATGFERAPQVPIWLSLAVIAVTMLVTTVASLLKARRDAAHAGDEKVPTGVGDAGRTPR
jgi:tellurite resistance protein TerC